LKILRKWPSNSEIYDAIRIAHQNAFNFAKMVDLVSNELELAPIVCVDNNNFADDLIQDDDDELMLIDDDELIEKQNNKGINEDLMIQKAALEVSRSAKIAQNGCIEGFDNADSENDDDDSIDGGDYDDSDEENDPEISHDDTSNHMTVSEIQYMLSNSRPFLNNINNNSQESEDTLFDTNGNLIVSSAINIRKSHNAFSRAERICGLRNKSIDMSKNSHEIIERNAANDLVQTLQENDEFTVNKPRSNRWDMRKRASDIRIPKNLSGILQFIAFFIVKLMLILFIYLFIVHEIELANVTENHLLEDGNFIIVLSDNKLCLGRVIAKYQKIGKRHAHINIGVDSIDRLSYISIHLYVYLYRGMFTHQSRIGRYLFTHISFKEIVYHLGRLDYIANEVSDMLTISGEARDIFQFFQKDSVFQKLLCIYK
jgi:hypothetical protein